MALSNKGRRWPLLLSVAGRRRARAAAIALAQAAARTSPAQAEAGRAAYAQNCAACHGSDADQRPVRPGAEGTRVPRQVGRRSPLSDLLDYIHTSMPPGQSRRAAGRHLRRDRRVHPAGERRRPPGADPGELPAARRPPQRAARGRASAGCRTRVTRCRPGPRMPDRFADFTPVTEAELANPAPEDWPAWRRSHLGPRLFAARPDHTGNVGELRIAWAQALPAGVNMNEPLVRDGVLYVFGYGDSVFAFDAASGRQLWRYQRRLPQGTPLNSRKTIALYGDKLYAATSDNHMVALDARTGRPVWDVALTDRPGHAHSRRPARRRRRDHAGLRQPGARRRADRRVRCRDRREAVGVRDRRQARPGRRRHLERPARRPRKGGSVWTSGSYDPVNRLALWGVGNTYDTAPVARPQAGR